MTWNPPAQATRRKRVSSVDRRVNRVAGALIIVIGAALSYSLVFTEFQQRVQFQWEVNNEGGRVPITHVTCPSPWSVVVDGASLEGVVAGDLCVLPARGILAQGLGLAVLALGLGSWVFTRNPRVKPMPTLPPSVRAMLWKR